MSATTHQRELDAFKRDVDLVSVAMDHGYAVSTSKPSSRQTIALDRADGDRIFVSRAQTGHWVYWNPRDAGDKGSVIDFLQRRTGASLGAVRQTLRRWSGRSPQIEAPGPLRTLTPVQPPDRGQVIAALARMQVAPAHPYLIRVRGIPARVLQSPRFLGKVLRDARHNAIFPHVDRDGVCGYEMKNTAFTGFARRGTKGLWMSALSTSDTALVIAETAIDALSYAALDPDPHTRYASTAGSPSPAQLALLEAAVRRLPQQAVVRIATDADRSGDRLAEVLRTMIECVRSDVRVQRSRPPEGKDWNDALLQRLGRAENPCAPAWRPS